MKKLVITHGTLASGIKGALDIIIGDFHQLEAIDCFVDEKPLEQLVDEYLSTFDSKNEKLLVFTELPVGSVNQHFLSKFKPENFYLDSKINLPLILELTLLDEDSINEDSIQQAVKMAKEQMIYFNQEQVTSKTHDDFDF